MLKFIILLIVHTVSFYRTILSLNYIVIGIEKVNGGLNLCEVNETFWICMRRQD